MWQGFRILYRPYSTTDAWYSVATCLHQQHSSQLHMSHGTCAERKVTHQAHVGSTLMLTCRLNYAMDSSRAQHSDQPAPDRSAGLPRHCSSLPELRALSRPGCLRLAFGSEAALQSRGHRQHHQGCRNCQADVSVTKGMPCQKLLSAGLGYVVYLKCVPRTHALGDVSTVAAIEHDA